MNLQKTLSFYTINYNSCCGLFINGLNSAEVISFQSLFVKFFFFCINNFEFCEMLLFFCANCVDHIVLVLHSVSVVYTIDFHILKYPCIAEINPLQL